MRHFKKLFTFKKSKNEKQEEKQEKKQDFNSDRNNTGKEKKMIILGSRCSGKITLFKQISLNYGTLCQRLLPTFIDCDTFPQLNILNVLRISFFQIS